MPIIAGPDGKRISFPEGTSDSDIATAFSPSIQTQPLRPPTPQPAAPSAGGGASLPNSSRRNPGEGIGDYLSRVGGGLWDWANKPLNVGYLRENIARQEEESNQSPVAGEPHPYVHLVKNAVEGFGANAAKMLLTPLSAGLLATGGLGEVPGSVGTAAKAVGIGAGVGFGVKGGKDIVQHPKAQPGEDTGAYINRIGSDAAMVLGGVASGAHAGSGIASDVMKAVDPETWQRVPDWDEGIPSAQSKGETRLQQAVGGNPTGPKSATVHVDPALAAEISKWNKADLPGKRIILKSTKTGGNTLRLAHTDSDLPGYQYTDTKSSNDYSDDGQQVEGQVPINLFKSNGVRGTSVPGHFLANDLGDAGTIPGVQPQPEVVATPPSESQTISRPQPPTEAQVDQAQPIETKPVISPPSEPKIVQKTVVQAEPDKGIQEVKLPVVEGTQTPKPIDPADIPLKPEPLDGGVGSGLAKRSGVEGTASTGAQGRLLDAQTYLAELRRIAPDFAGNEKFADNLQEAEIAVHVAKGNTSQRIAKIIDAPLAAKPVDVSPLEDKIRPIVGKLLDLKRLKTGEAASHTIDRAIDASHSLTDSVDPRDAARLSKLLNAPVGKGLTEDQISKLEALRGAGERGEAKIFPIRKETTESRLASNEDNYRAQQNASMVAMVEAWKDPNTAPALRARIEKAMSDSYDTGGQDWMFTRGKLKYPKPVDLPIDHPEAPFKAQALGHPITPLNVDNAKAIFGGSFQDILSMDSNDPGRYVTPSERIEWLLQKNGEVTPEDLKKFKITPEDLKKIVANRPASEESIDEESSNKGVFDIRDVLGIEGNEKGNVIQPKAATDAEFKEYDRQLGQRVLDRRIGKMEQELRSKVGEWNTKRGPDPTPLVDQLSKLSDEAKKLLPQELFTGEKPSSTETNTATSPAGNEKPVASTRTPKAKSATIKPGTKTETFGLRHTNWDVAIQKEFPEALRGMSTIQDATKISAAETRQSQYARAMQTYYEALKINDPFALKQAVDTIVRPSEAGFLDISKAGTGAYTPDQAQAINHAVADKFLSRWEAMSESELLKKKAGLTASNLVDRIANSVPVSEDPTIRAEQAEQYNELKDRHDTLLAAVGPTTNIHDSLVDWMNNFIEDRSDKRMMREVRGTQGRNNNILRTQFEGVDRLMNELPLPELDRFSDNISRGTTQSSELFKAMDPKFLQKWEQKNGPVPDPNELATRLRYSYDAARDRVTEASGDFQEFIVNYLAEMYDNVAKSRPFAQSWAARRPLAGNSDFLKQKIYEFHSDALKAGLQPVTTNPIRMMMMRVEQLNRYTMAHEFKNKLVSDGQAAWYNVGETPPDGHEILNDRIFGQGGQGNYFAPSKVARTFNNFVSTGLTGQWKIPYTNLSLYDGLRSTNNLANQMQLGFSLFHGVETTLNSAFTAGATGLKQVLKGQLGAGGVNILKGLTGITPLIEDTWNGSKGLINFNDPTKALDYAQLGNDLEAANANVRVDPAFRLQQVENLKKNWNTATDGLQPIRTRAAAVAKAGTNLMGSAVEGLSAPLMNWLIPRVKLGAFYRMAQEVHESNVGQPPEIINSKLQSAWDSIDNRFGQVNYDNMFLNKTLKDMMALTVRSPGWNIGTLREVGGGAFDLGKSVKDAAQGKGFEISNRTAYTAAMVSGTMLFNAIYQYIHTGQSAEGIDYFFPKDGTRSSQGEDNRVYPKTYVYDFINMYHDPISTVWHKAAPDSSTVADLIRNEDYYHRVIQDPGNNPVQNAASTLGYMAHQFVPFSFGNYTEARMRGKTGADIGSFAGILPAPRWVGRSEAENLAYKYYEGAQAQSPTDEGTFEKKAAFIDLRNKVSQGTITDDQIQKALDAGKLNPKMVQYLYNTKINPDTGKPIEPQVVTWIKPLRSESEVWNVWKAASSEEKKVLLPTVIEKMVNLSSGPQQEEYLKELEDYANKQ